MPLTIRQIFYRLVANYGYPNSQSSYNQLSKQLVKARERGDVNPNRIEDRSREFLGGDNGFENPEEFLESRIYSFLNSPKHYHRHMWSLQPKFVIVWVEKDALSRVISRIANKYKVITAPSKGYASFAYIYEAINMFPEDKEIIILHFADHDPSGLDMTRDLEERFERYIKLRELNLDFNVERIALNYDQVIRYGLNPNPAKTADPRASNYIAEFGNECWELDAIDPNELQKLVSESITQHIDVEIWNDTIKKQKQEQQELEEIFLAVKEKFREIGLI